MDNNILLFYNAYKDLVMQYGLLLKYYESGELKDKNAMLKLHIEIERIRMQIDVFQSFIPEERSINQYNYRGDFLWTFPTIKFASYFTGIFSRHIKESLDMTNPLIEKTFFLYSDSLATKHIKQLPWVKIRQRVGRKRKN